MKKIDELYIITGTDNKGNEGIASALHPVQRTMIPLVGSEDRLTDLLVLAQAASDVSGRTFNLIKMTGREQIREIKPNPGGDGS